MSDGRLLSLTSVQSTSGQIALLLVMNLYYKFFGELTEDDFYTDGELDSQKLDLFKSRLRWFLSAILSEQSLEKMQNPPIRPQTSYFHPFSRGKMRYFDSKHKLVLTDHGAIELKNLLDSLAIQEHQEVHILNEFLPAKAAPLSARRIAATNSVLATISALFLFGAICGEDECLLDLLDHFHEQTVVEDASGITISTLLFLFVVASRVKQIQQNRTNSLANQYTLTSTVALDVLKKNPLDENVGVSITDEHYNQMFVTGNVFALKGAIACESAMRRSYATLTTAVVFGVGFLLMDLFTGGASLALRIGLGCIAASVTMAVRYAKKTEQNKTNLYAKVHRPWITSAFQKELRPVLSVYGLQPVNPKLDISSDTVNVRRKVSDDVECFLNSKKDEMPQGSLEQVEAWVEKNLPLAYLKHPKYFIQECLFQVRIKNGEDENLVKVEREQLFSLPTAEFFAREQARGIKHLHQRIMIYKAEVEAEHMRQGNTTPYLWKKPYLYSDIPTLCDDTAVDKKIKSDLAWNPLITVKRLVQKESGHLHENIKRELSWTLGYIYYAAAHFALYPWQNSEKVLDAYYAKRYEGARKKLMKTTDSMCASADALFNKMLQEDEQKEQKAIKLGEKTLKQQHEDNMAGVALSSILASGATVLLLAVSPAFAFLPYLYNGLADVASQCVTVAAESFTYLCTSSIFKTLSVNTRRELKTGARYQLPPEQRIDRCQ